MSTTNRRTAALRDEAIPALASLLTDGVPEPLTAAFASMETTVDDAVAAQVTWWPGRSVTVRYRAVLGGRLRGTHQVVATAGEIPEGALVVRAADMAVGVWVVPEDPALPGLAAALHPVTARDLLRDLGADAGTVSTRLRAYRPGRRAVVEIGDGRWKVFAKVVPPHEVMAIHRTHLSVQAALPVPRSLGVSPHQGVIVLEAIPGSTLRSALDGEHEPLPPPEAIDGLLSRLANVTTTRESPSPLQRLARLVPVLAAVVPDERPRIQRIAALGEDLAATTTAHGDFHEAQVLVHGGAMVGLIDLDTVGRGRPGDDPAAMLGHLAVRRLGTRRRHRVGEMERSLAAHWVRTHDPVDLYRRVAAVIAGLATGPFRVQHPAWPEMVSARLALAERWLDRSDRLDERSLIAASATPHQGHRHRSTNRREGARHATP